MSEADESTKGPASLIVIDPDGNPILVDQHNYAAAFQVWVKLNDNYTYT